MKHFCKSSTWTHCMSEANDKKKNRPTNIWFLTQGFLTKKPLIMIGGFFDRKFPLFFFLFFFFFFFLFSYSSSSSLFLLLLPHFSYSSSLVRLLLLLLNESWNGTLLASFHCQFLPLWFYSFIRAYNLLFWFKVSQLFGIIIWTSLETSLVTYVSFIHGCTVYVMTELLFLHCAIRYAEINNNK